MSTPTPSDADPTLDHDERELAALYRQMPQAEPDAAMDARILSESRRPFVHRPRRLRGLLLGLASVATLAMAAGLAWHAYRPGPGIRTQAPAIAVPQARSPASAGVKNQVIQVHILSGQEAGAASRNARPTMATTPDQHAPGSMQSRAATTPAPAAKTLVVPVRIIPQGVHTSTTDASEQGAAALIDQARQALANGNQARARQLVRELLLAHPGQPLPADLASLRPAAKTPGSP